MNTAELDELLTADCKLSTVYVGTFPCDMLPSMVDHPAALVINTDPSTMPGSHWVAIYVDSGGRGEYFDSYGDAPENVECVKFLNTNCRGGRNWIFSKKELQAMDSNVCGQYCVGFLKWRVRGGSLEEFQNQFGSDTDRNDKSIAQAISSSKVDLSSAVTSVAGASAAYSGQCCISRRCACIAKNRNRHHHH
jgi:hypothetical protein